MEPRPTFYILDAYSRIYQVFHAIPAMTGPAGQPTNIVFGLFRDMLNLLRVRKPDYVAVAFDGAGPVFRSEIFADYKANRPSMPDDMRPQVEVARRLFEAFGMPVWMHEGAEADDVIATLARKGAERGLDVVILTSDKDARQLLTDQIRILNLRDNKFIDIAALKIDWGITPEQVVDYLSLTGDSVDNVPGVPGIGPKTATELLQKFGTLDALLEGIDQVKGAKKQENLRAHADTARRARTLVQLKEDLPLAIDWNALQTTGYHAKALKDLCAECGFHGFLNEIVDNAREPEQPWNTKAYQLVDTPERLASFVAELEKQPKFSFDTETTSVDPLRAEVVGYSFSWREGDAFYVPVKGPMFSRFLDPNATLDALKPALKNPKTEKVGQNLKYDMLVLSRVGVELGGPITDTMILSYLLESGERNHGLDDLSRRLLDHTMIPITSLIGKGKNQKRMDEVDVEAVAEYAGEDADAAWRLESILAPKCRKEGLWDLYTSLEMPLIRVLAKMETAGIRVDVARLRTLSTEFAGRMETTKAAIYETAGREFNIGSGPQLRQILFDELKLPVVSKTPRGEASTAVEVLEELALQHPLPRLIIQFRQLEKLKSTYLDSLATIAHGDGRVHTSFSQAVAATGRLSSVDPNLQNIPTRTEDGRQIRQAFVAGFPGWSLVTADYSQIELRILAHYSRDPALVEAFRENRDVHTSVAAGVFGVAESEVTKDQRRVAKMVNFGVIYGLSAFGLASRLGIPQKDAAAFIDNYFAKYAGVAAFIDQTREIALKTGRVETILGRRRAIDGIKNLTGRNLNLAERTAINTVIQGSAADLIKKAMLDVDAHLAQSGLQARMLLQIHDELVFESPNEEIAALSQLVHQAMTQALDLSVPIGVEIAAGPNWLDVTPVDSR
jgi:DNA polymerase-1